MIAAAGRGGTPACLRPGRRRGADKAPGGAGRGTSGSGRGTDPVGDRARSQAGCPHRQVRPGQGACGICRHRRTRAPSWAAPPRRSPAVRQRPDTIRWTGRPWMRCSIRRRNWPIHPPRCPACSWPCSPRAGRSTTRCWPPSPRMQPRCRSGCLDRLDNDPTLADCELRSRAQAVSMTTGDQQEARQIRSLGRAGSELAELVARIVTDCICAAFNPPCAPCEDTDVLLACLEVRDCTVVRICNADRDYVISGSALRYWLPAGLLHELECSAAPRPRRDAARRTWQAGLRRSRFGAGNPRRRHGSCSGCRSPDLLRDAMDDRRRAAVAGARPRRLTGRMPTHRPAGRRAAGRVAELTTLADRASWASRTPRPRQPRACDQPRRRWPAHRRATRSRQASRGRAQPRRTADRPAADAQGPPSGRPEARPAAGPASPEASDDT